MLGAQGSCGELYLLYGELQLTAPQQRRRDFLGFSKIGKLREIRGLQGKNVEPYSITRKLIKVNWFKIRGDARRLMKKDRAVLFVR